MSRIPTREDLGQRPVPNPPIPQSQVVSVDLTQQSKAYQSLAQDLKQFGTGMAYYQQAKDRSAFVDAKATFLRKSIEERAKLENDPDFSTYGERYRASMAEAKKEAIETIAKSNPFGTGAFGNQYANDLKNELDLHEAQGLENLANIASKKEGDFERANLDSLLTNNSKALLQTPDEKERASLMLNTNEAIDLRAERGFISQEAAVKLKQNFAENYATQRIALLPTSQQMQLIKPTRSKNGELLFPETGNWTDALSTNTKIKIYENAQAEIKTNIKDELIDVEQAGKLGLHVPKEKLINLANRAYGAGMNDIGQSINKYVAIQDSADQFAKLSTTQQQVELNNLRTSIEAGNLKEVDKYSTFQNIFETKAKYLKEDPYAYYSAHGVIAAPQPIDITNPVAISQNLEARRTENEKVKQVEGQSFEMPILTKQEIEQLKNINQNQPADKVAMIINNIGINLRPNERAALSRQLAKEAAPTLAVAMSFNNQKDAINILEGSKLKGEVNNAELQRQIAGKLSGYVLDPEESVRLSAAVTDYYKKLAFDDGNVNKDVDNELLTQSIEKTIAKQIEISPAGKKSKVFSYRDDSGNFVDENDLEDTFNSINDDVLKKTNGSLPFLPSGDVIGAKEILKDTKLITYGNGRYVPYYEGIGYLTGQDGKPYVIDAKKVKALTGNAPAKDERKIQTRPSQSIFGFN